MELDKTFKNVTCVYKVTCVVNNKILIGCTTNLYNRVCQYRNDINRTNPLKHYNKSFYNDVIEYGLKSFKIEIVESYSSITDEELKNKESYYMNLYNSLNPEIGYNIRQDIDGHCVCADSTREIKRMQTKEQWASGVRINHSGRMKDYWCDNFDRKLVQSKIMSKNKTKFIYTIINNKTKEVIKENVEYKDLYLHINGHSIRNARIAQRFCYINKLGKKTTLNNVESDDPEIYLNSIIIGEYLITRKKI